MSSSITQYIKAALKEDKYSEEYNSNIHTRMNYINTTHLNCMESHLDLAHRQAKSKIWTEANKKLLEKIDRELQWRNKINDAEIRALEAEEAREQKLIELEEVKAYETERVLKSILEASKQRAINEVAERERERLVSDRVQMLALAKIAERRKMNMMYFSVAFAFTSLTILSVFLYTNLSVLIGCIVAVLFITFLINLRAYFLARIVPIAKSRIQMEEEILKCTAEFQEAAMAKLRIEEREYNIKMKLESKERKALRKIRKEKAKREAEEVERMKTARLELITAALNDKGKEAELAQLAVSVRRKSSSEVEFERVNNSAPSSYIKMVRSESRLSRQSSKLDEDRLSEMEAYAKHLDRVNNEIVRIPTNLPACDDDAPETRNRSHIAIGKVSNEKGDVLLMEINAVEKKKSSELLRTYDIENH